MAIENDREKQSPKRPNPKKSNKAIRAGLSTVGGAIPFAGGLFSAASGYWSESEQEAVNDFLQHWVEMLKEELKEKQFTIMEVMQRLDMHDDEIKARIKSDEYQSLVKKCFREWAAGESEQKRILIRNILTNSATKDHASDDVVRMFVDWIDKYSDTHFEVIAAIFNEDGITRRAIWSKIGRKPTREDSADADLFRLLIRDLSTGGIIRQHRATDYHGNFLKRPSGSKRKSANSSATKSAFDNEDGYELTSLGQQFIHYAMTDLPKKIDHFNED